MPSKNLDGLCHPYAWRALACGVVVIASYWAGSELRQASRPPSEPAPPANTAGTAKPGAPTPLGTVASTPGLIRGHAQEEIFAVPRAALNAMRFTRFDEDFNLTTETRTILKITDSQAERLRAVALEFLPRYRASQTRRIRTASNPKYTFEIPPASDEEAASLKREFAEAASAVVGDETAWHLPFPIEINTGNVFQVFHVVTDKESGEFHIHFGKIEQGDMIFSTSFSEAVDLAPEDPIPSRWQHLLSLEGIRPEGDRR